jgi:hypothetical protein
MKMFNEGRKAIDKYLNKDDWQIWVSMNKGQMTLPVFQRYPFNLIIFFSRLDSIFIGSLSGKGTAVNELLYPQ